MSHRKEVKGDSARTSAGRKGRFGAQMPRKTERFGALEATSARRAEDTGTGRGKSVWARALDPI